MELKVNDALQRGIVAHKAGKLQEAERYYIAILKAQPKHPHANHNMGVLAVGIGKVQEALPFFNLALEGNPNISQFWLSYLDALIKLGRLDDARSAFEQAKSNGAQGVGFDQLSKRLGSSNSKNSNVQEPSKDKLNSLINLYKQNRLQEVFDETQRLTKEHPRSLNL